MAVSDVTDPAAVRRAIAEFDRVGRESFLGTYGFGHSVRFFVLHDGRLYDSKAILGVAHGIQHPVVGPLPHTDFSGGVQTVNKLIQLGFEVIDTDAETLPSGRVFGEIPGQPIGSIYANRAELSASGVHRPLQAGISGSESEGADSIVVSGGYEDDEDYGGVIIYTGHGGNDPQSRRQIADQELKRGNLALARNCDEGRPVRVVRGAGGDSLYSPPNGFRYDGLFDVERYWSTVGRSGFRICQFRLVQFAEPPSERAPEDEEGLGPAPRMDVTVQRLVRSTAVIRRVKELHGHQCQVCGEAIWTPVGPYAEGAHIRGLGRPHDGPDISGNVLCLCANDHVRFDSGAIFVTDGLDVIDRVSGDAVGKLRTVAGHVIDPAYLRYHREHFGAS